MANGMVLKLFRLQFVSRKTFCSMDNGSSRVDKLASTDESEMKL